MATIAANWRRCSPSTRGVLLSTPTCRDCCYLPLAAANPLTTATSPCLLLPISGCCYPPSLSSNNKYNNGGHGGNNDK